MHTATGDLYTPHLTFHRVPCSACVISGYAIFIYELFEVFPDEVEYIWPTRWSTVKILYLLNRYGNFIFLTVGMLQNMGQWRSDAPLVRSSVARLAAASDCTATPLVLCVMRTCSSATTLRSVSPSCSSRHSRPYIVRVLLSLQIASTHTIISTFSTCAPTCMGNLGATHQDPHLAGHLVRGVRDRERCPQYLRRCLGRP